MDEQTNPQANDGEAGLRELALALLAPRYPDTAENEAPQLLVGQLPPDFTSDFPLPPGSRIVGSLQSSRPTVVLDTAQPADEVVDFYRERLTATGWTAQEDIPPRQGGFLYSSTFDRRFGNFSRGKDGPSLNVMTYDAPGGRTAVHLTLSPEGAAPMYGIGPRHRRRMGPDIWRILPPIAPPPRSQQWQEGGSSGGDRVSASARLETDLDLPTVAAHYIAQLEKGGWQRQNSDEHEPVAWSTWISQDEDKEPWSGLFVILKRPEMPRRYWVQVLAEWIGKQPQGDMRMAASVVSGIWIGSQSHTVDEGNVRSRPREGHEKRAFAHREFAA